MEFHVNEYKKAAKGMRVQDLKLESQLVKTTVVSNKLFKNNPEFAVKGNEKGGDGVIESN